MSHKNAILALSHIHLALTARGLYPPPSEAWDLIAFNFSRIRRLFAFGPYLGWRSWQDFCFWFIGRYCARVQDWQRAGGSGFCVSVRDACARFSDMIADVEDVAASAGAPHELKHNYTRRK